MKLYTIGFTQKTAQEFFEKIKNNRIDLLLDIRLNNISQLAGFAKGKDLEYFLREICNCKYVYDINFAPTTKLLDDYRAKKISWDEYEKIFKKIVQDRKIDSIFQTLYTQYDSVCLLCSEPTAEHCHRRLVAEFLKEHIKNTEIIHI